MKRTLDENDSNDDAEFISMQTFFTTFGPLSSTTLHTAYTFRHRKAVSGGLIQDWPCLESYPCQGHKGVRLVFDDGTTWEHECSSIDIGRLLYVFLGNIRNHCSEYATVSFKLELDIFYNRVTSLYWVAKQQQWSDMAEHFIPYVIAAVSSKNSPAPCGGRAVFGQEVTKRQKL